MRTRILPTCRARLPHQWDRLAPPGSCAEEMAHLSHRLDKTVPLTEDSCNHPWSVSLLLDSSMLLLQVMMQLPFRPLGDTLFQLPLALRRSRRHAHRAWPGRGDPISNHSCRTKERLSRCLILSLTEEDIHQVSVSINGLAQVNPTPFPLQIRLGAIPTLSYPPASICAQALIQHGGKFGFSRSDGFMSKHDTTVQERFRKRPKAEFVT